MLTLVLLIADESTEITTQPTLHQKEDPSKPNTDTDRTPEPGSELLPQVDPSKANDPQGLIDHNGEGFEKIFFNMRKFMIDIIDA